jgi:hypothetical protein
MASVSDVRGIEREGEESDSRKDMNEPYVLARLVATAYFPSGKLSIIFLTPGRILTLLSTISSSAAWASSTASTTSSGLAPIWSDILRNAFAPEKPSREWRWTNGLDLSIHVDSGEPRLIGGEVANGPLPVCSSLH